VIQQDLQDAHLVKPVLDGNAIMDLFGLKKGGSFLSSVINQLVAWQFDNRYWLRHRGYEEMALRAERDIRNSLLKYRPRRAYTR
jgi:hypothetical protein